MLRLENRELDRAIARCKEVKPTVRVKTFGEYSVTSSKGDSIYTVRCYRDPQGFKTVDCNCTAGKRDRLCFHAIAAVTLHIYMAMMNDVLRRVAQRRARVQRSH